MFTSRHTARKVFISDVINGKFESNESGSFLITNSGMKVFRIRLIGTIMQKFISDDENYAFIVIDDGTETIRVRAFDNIDLFKELEVGDIVDVFGRPRVYNEEIYVMPEIIRKIEDPNFEIMRKLEILSAPKIEEEKVEEEVEEEIVEEVVDEEPKRKVFEIIKKLDKGEGVELKKIIEESKLDRPTVINALRELMNDGDIFEPRTERFKVLE